MLFKNGKDLACYGKYDMDNKERPFIFEGQKVRTQIWLQLGCRQLLFFVKRSFGKDFERRKFRLIPDPVTTGNNKYNIMIVNPKNSSEVKYPQNDDTV